MFLFNFILLLYAYVFVFFLLLDSKCYSVHLNESDDLMNSTAGNDTRANSPSVRYDISNQTLVSNFMNETENEVLRLNETNSSSVFLSKNSKAEKIVSITQSSKETTETQSSSISSTSTASLTTQSELKNTTHSTLAISIQPSQTTSTVSSNKIMQRRVCYYANWAPYRDLTPALYPDNIDPALCTHIHYAFAKVDPKTLALMPTEEHDMNWTEKSNMPLYIRLYGLKRRNSALKILLAVGGWSAKSTGFNLATRTHLNRSKFINQTIRLLREWNFDGVDLDWEFPGDKERGADSQSRENFNALVNQFRKSVDAESAASGKRRLLITSAVAADPKKIDAGYVPSNLCKQLDYISIMTYDYHGTWDDYTGLNSPLYSRNDPDFSNQTGDNWKNANYSINYWISNGCPPEKINFGLAAYGRSFTLKNSTSNKVGAPILKGGVAGSYTKEEGIYSYYEICEKLNVDGWKKYWDDKQQSVYATLDDQWVGYDNQRSISLKVKWAYSMLLGGTMLWTLDFDDYSGQFCDQGTFPIANAIKAEFDEIFPDKSLISSNETTSSEDHGIDDTSNYVYLTKKADESASPNSTSSTYLLSTKSTLVLENQTISTTTKKNIIVNGNEIIIANDMTGINIVGIDSAFVTGINSAAVNRYNVSNLNISSLNTFRKNNVNSVDKSRGLFVFLISAVIIKGCL